MLGLGRNWNVRLLKLLRQLLGKATLKQSKKLQMKTSPRKS